MATQEETAGRTLAANSLAVHALVALMEAGRADAVQDVCDRAYEEAGKNAANIPGFINRRALEAVARKEVSNLQHAAEALYGTRRRQGL